ncbi:Glutathione-independent glyoxalase HSP31 [Mycena sanguinolenta]|uniref:D-lactate dehydratase n=1 Tax=Mycena sanguinolenta TaxID=230812 RepID=A0A8H7CX00_9AGAR|nr:Glutathione-independent glyoxalase HSP31 [Mycena sanguinolenta]
MPAILFVLTSAATTLTGAQAGWYIYATLLMAAHPYYILAPHATIDFASPAGPNPPISEKSVKLFESDPECIKFLADETVKSKLASAKKLSEREDYDAVFYVGGHGPVMDLAVDPINIKLASEFYQAGKITAAVCHGSAALTGATDAQGKSIFAGKAATGFSNAEETAINMVKDVPFLLEDKIKSLGGKYEKAADLWAPHVVVDGNLYTGQNPASASPIGQAVLKGLKL